LLKKIKGKSKEVSVDIYEKKKSDPITLNYSIKPTNTPLYYAIINGFSDLVVQMMENDLVKKEEFYNVDQKEMPFYNRRKNPQTPTFSIPLPMLLCMFYDKKYDDVIIKLAKQENFQPNFMFDSEESYLCLAFENEIVPLVHALLDNPSTDVKMFSSHVCTIIHGIDKKPVEKDFSGALSRLLVDERIDIFSFEEKVLSPILKVILRLEFYDIAMALTEHAKKMDKTTVLYKCCPEFMSKMLVDEAVKYVTAKEINKNIEQRSDI
jgi:hypothetical protein